jgi:cobalt-precorrin 5A hydrolase
MFERGIAIVALTRRGVATSRRIGNGLNKAHIPHKMYAPDSLLADAITPFNGELGELIAKLFNAVDAIIAVMAVGIVVRSIAPYITSKMTDPAVVVVDDTGKHAISLLSGHIGGANQLTTIVAEEIGAIPVVTTATELLGRKSVEAIAEEHDLYVANLDSLTPVNYAIVNDGKILFATVSHENQVNIDPSLFKVIASVDQLKEMMKIYDAGIVIAPNILSLEGLSKPVVILIPKPNQLSSKK